MPTKELLAATVLILTGIFVTHPLTFTNSVRGVEFSILKEVTRTDTWYDPSLFHSNRYTKRPSKIYRQHSQHTSTAPRQ
jgi:hypothetical protein